jgi:hypothetical protein
VWTAAHFIGARFIYLDVGRVCDAKHRQSQLRLIENPPWTNCIVTQPGVDVSVAAMIPASHVSVFRVRGIVTVSWAAGVQDMVLHVAVDRVANFIEFWAILRTSRLAVGLKERRFVSAFVNCVCHWLFQRLLCA